RQSKSGKARHVVLTDEGNALFEQLTAGRSGSEPMFGGWGKSRRARPLREAGGRGKSKPRFSFHGRRHTWASLAVMAGMPLLVVAKNLGHDDSRMAEKHYGHLSESYVASEIRKRAPRFGVKSNRKVIAISR